ncbi:hypothetical protein FRC07_007738, partial [Ceratobasidium sp. 392]
DDDKPGGNHTSEESLDDEEFMERVCNMIEATVSTIELAKPILHEASLDIPSATSTSTSTAPTTGPFAIPQGTEDKVDSPVEVIIPGIVIVPPTPPASPLPAADLPLPLPLPSTTGVAAIIPLKAALTPKKKEDIFAALEEEEDEELAQQAKRAPKSARGRWRDRF